MTATIHPINPTAGNHGEALYNQVATLYPIHRSITGEGLRTTLALIGKQIPLEIHEVPTGTPVLDWVVPREWRIRDAHITTTSGERVVDLADSPLHVVQYSTPVQATMTLQLLRPYLHTLPQLPTLIPYRTSYYTEAWGFCLAQRTLDRLALGGEDQELAVVIDSELVDGALTYGECVLQGERDEEVLISAHVCHPALANDNASSVVVAAALAERLKERPRLRYTYRFLFAPGTIGAVTWLARNADNLSRIRHGLVIANLGDVEAFHYKATRRGTLSSPLAIDRAVALALRDTGVSLRPFTPTGYDERQFGSPGFDLPVGRLTRTPPGEYPQYHTSADNMQLISPKALAQSLESLQQIVDVLEGDAYYESRRPFGEPQLGRRGLYEATGGGASSVEQEALLWVLNLCDGNHSLIEVAERSGLPFGVVRQAANRLLEAGLLVEHAS